MDVGADLWHMNCVAAGFGYKIAGHEAAFYARIDDPGFFIADGHGHRFLNETAVESHSGFLAMHAIDYLDGIRHRLPGYLVFDERTRKGAPIVTETGTSFNGSFPWSRDNSEEVRRGWITQAGDIGELAHALGLPAPALQATLEAFNAAAVSGHDALGRRPELMRPLEPPFYGIAIWPVLLNTQGGPRRDEHARVINAFGQPIPGLYSAGELGSIWGPLYPGAGNVCECIVYGRIAGRNAAASS